MKHELVIYPNPVLKQVCEKVKLPLSKEDKELLDEMYQFVKDPANNAVGLSAPQFGVTKRMFVIRIKFCQEVFNVKMVNPIIMVTSYKPFYVNEGESCLSEPGENVKVSRASKIVLMGYDAIVGKNVRIPLSGFWAAVAQHELDHLNGILLHDHKEKEETK